MISISGTDYLQPSDLSIVAYSGTKYILISSGNTVQRVLMSALATGTHNHTNEVIYPSAVRNNGDILIRSETGQITISAAANLGSPGSSIILSKTGTAAGKAAFYHGGVLCFRYNNWGIGFNGADTPQSETSPGFALPNTQYKGQAVAYQWSTYACSIADKSLVAPISAAKDKVASITGITFVQNSIPGIGVSAEDLDSLGLPNLVTKEDGKYISINLVGLIPVLVEAVKELKTEVDTLKKSMLT